MNSSIISVSELLSNAKNLISAGFSVGYSFDELKAEEYFDELIKNSAFSSPIFSGILILEKSKVAAESLTVIDGLQRLTTISLLLCALCDTYKGTSKNNEEAKDKILNRYLISGNEPKLKLTGEEQNIYKKILFSQWLIDKEIENNLVLAYHSFVDKIKARKISGTELFRIISKIQFMVIVTDKSEVPVRDLYQALNSNNKGKSQINLISDFIIQEDEDAIVVWQQIADSFKNTEHLLESFVRDFLITRSDEEISNKSALYNNFKNYFYKISKYQDTKTIIEGMYKYSQYYLKILSADFDNSEVQEQIKILNESSGRDAYPYLMEVLDDLENAHINMGAFLNILMMINLFIKSQQESSFSNININFASLSKELNKMLVLKDYVPDLMEEDKLTINVINKLSTFEVQ